MRWNRNGFRSYQHDERSLSGQPLNGKFWNRSSRQEGHAVGYGDEPWHKLGHNLTSDSFQLTIQPNWNDAANDDERGTVHCHYSGCDTDSGRTGERHIDGNGRKYEQFADSEFDGDGRDSGSSDWS